MACCHEEFVYETPGLVCTEGRGSSRFFHEAFFEAIPDYHGVIEGEAWSEETVALWGRFTGTVTGSFMGMPPTGARVEVKACCVLRFEGELIIGETVYLDIATLFTQAGVPVRYLPALTSALQ